MRRTGYIGVLLLLCCFSLVGQARVGSTSFSPEETREICRDGAAEGTFLVQLESFTQRLRLNIVCAANGKIVASVHDQILGGMSYAMLYSEVTASEVRFYSFSLESEDAITISSNNIGMQLRLKKQDLLQGRIRGFMRGVNQLGRLAISGDTKTEFPRVTGSPEPLPPGGFPEGSFETTIAGLRHVLILESLGGMVRATLNLGPNARALMLFDGPPENQYPYFANTSGFGRGESPRSRLNHVRGRFLNPDRVEFYLIDMKEGVRGPFIAQRMRSQR